MHISTVHPRWDTRIFYRECVGLYGAGYEVYLLVADGRGDEITEGIHVLDIGKENSRLKNFFKSHARIKEKVSELKPHIVHFHDPELMYVGRKIQSRGIHVIFDIHENTAVQILDKGYIPKFLRKPVSFLYKRIEGFLIKKFHLVIAEHSYFEVYGEKGMSITTVLNTPVLEDFRPYKNTTRRGNQIFYIGGISNDRGLDVTLEALKILKKRGCGFFMHYVGPIAEEKVQELALDEIKDHIRFYGRMDFKGGYEISKNCIVGLSVLKPIKNYIGSYSTKIFEYMAVGLPVITSNFPLYKDIVEKYNCGYCIDPYAPGMMADRIEELIKSPEKAVTMGLNGIEIVKDGFNWNSEEQKLVKLYNTLSGVQDTPDYNGKDYKKT